MKIKIQQIIEILSKNNISYKTNLQDEVSLSSISSILDADSESIIFLFDEKYLDLLKKSKAKCCVLKKEYLKLLPSDIGHILVDDIFSFCTFQQSFFSK